MAMFLDLANLSAVTIALPTIQKDLNVEVAELQWTISAYALTVSHRLLGHAKICLLEVRLLIFAVWWLSSPWRTGGRCLGVRVQPLQKGIWYSSSLCSHRNVLLFGMSFFALFTMVSALTPSFIGLAIARAFQGNNRHTRLREGLSVSADIPYRHWCSFYNPSSPSPYRHLL